MMLNTTNIHTMILYMSGFACAASKSRRMFFRNHEKMPGEKLTTSMRRAGRRTSVNAVNAVSAVTTETAKNRTLKKWSQFSQMDFQLPKTKTRTQASNSIP